MVLTTALFFYACMANTANYGRNQFSNEARRIFEDFRVLPDYNYYYTGSNVHPDALIAVHKSYTVTSEGVWTKMEAADKNLKYLVETLLKDLSPSPNGYNILDPHGKQIGLYYSKWDPLPAKMVGEKSVWIYPPDKKEFIRLKRNK